MFWNINFKKLRPSQKYINLVPVENCQPEYVTVVDCLTAGSLHPPVSEHFGEGSVGGEEREVEVEHKDVWHAEQDRDLQELSMLTNYIKWLQTDLLIADIEEGRLHEEDTEPLRLFDAGLHCTALSDWQRASVTCLQQEAQPLLIHLQQSPGEIK